MKCLLLVSLRTVVSLNNTLASQSYGNIGPVGDASYEFDFEEPKDDSKVKEAVDQLYDAMWRSNNAEEKKRIDPKVAQFIKDKSSGVSSLALDPSLIQSIEGYCRSIARAMRPGSHYTGTFAVHTVNFDQTVEISECIDDDSVCPCDGKLIMPRCEVPMRDVELLTLPTGKEEFDISDFKINKFRVPNGCVCDCPKRNSSH